MRSSGILLLMVPRDLEDKAVIWRRREKREVCLCSRYNVILLNKRTARAVNGEAQGCKSVFIHVVHSFGS